MIEENLNIIRGEMGDKIALVAVTKHRAVSEIVRAIESGVTHIGENRVQEAARKFPELPAGITRHLIGHLQRNKVREGVRLFDVIQSVDSLKLGQKIDTECERQRKVMPILIQVNTSGEGQKSGVAPAETLELARTVSRLSHVKIQGLMTLAKQSEDEGEVLACFENLKQLFDEIKSAKIPNIDMKWLSMGMSGDYKLAIQAGANMVRLGRGIFE